jgi:hypothetical protein
MPFRHPILDVSPTPAQIRTARHELGDRNTLLHSVWLTKGCVAGYRQRNGCNLTRGSAMYELLRRMRTDGRFSINPPNWLVGTNPVDLGYVIIDGMIALTLRFDHRRRAPYAAIRCTYRSDSNPRRQRERAGPSVPDFLPTRHGS